MLRALFDGLWLTTEIQFFTGAIFLLLERARPSIREQRRWRRGIKLDIGYVYLGAIIAVLSGLIGFGHRIDTLVQLPHIRVLSRVQSGLAAIPLVLQVVIAIVIADFFGYWKHRALHTRFLWSFHAVHHSSEDVDWLSNERMHPVEMIMTTLFQLVPLLMLGFPVLAIVWAGQIRRIHSVYEHANLSIDYGRGHYVLVSPIFHRWHHSTDASVVDKNFANVFALFDFLFGTMKMPEAEPPADTFGVPGFPRDLWGQTARPVRDLVAIMLGKPPRDELRDA